MKNGKLRGHASRFRLEQYTERAKQYVNGCIGKRHYPSKRQAMGVKRAMLVKAPSYDEFERLEIHLRAYKCGCCGRWHLGGDGKG